MKASLGFALALAFLAAPAVAMAMDVSQDFPVKGWCCADCTPRTEKSVAAVKGVKSAKANYEKKILAVTFDDAQTGPDAIAAAIEKSGFSCPLKKK